MMLAGWMFLQRDNTSALLARAVFSGCSVALLAFGSSRLLRRDGYPADALGLRPNLPHARGFIIGIGVGVLLMASMAAVLALQVPFHWVRGSSSLGHAALAAHAYFWNNFAEELIFRGYALVVLSNYLGPRKAVLVLALPFGLFHLPGMGIGMAAAKMVATTAMMSIVFSYGFLLTGTLWTAIGIHVTANVWLHTVTGLDGGGSNPLWKPVFGHWPTGYDAGFWTLIGVTSVFSCFAYLNSRRKPFSQTSEDLPAPAE
jgi:uncharacterized protein